MLHIISSIKIGQGFEHPPNELFVPVWPSEFLILRRRKASREKACPIVSGTIDQAILHCIRVLYTAVDEAPDMRARSHGSSSLKIETHL